MSHVKVIYKYYKPEEKGSQNTIGNIEIPPVAINIYGRIDWVGFGLKPFYTKEKDLDRWYSKLNPTTCKTFMKYLELVTPISPGKRKSWDKQIFIGIRQMGETQITCYISRKLKNMTLGCSTKRDQHLTLQHLPGL